SIESGPPGEKIRGLDLLVGYLRLFAQQKNLDPGAKAVAAEFVATIANTRGDAAKPVSIWATYLTARVNGDERGGAIDALLGDQAWPARLPGVLAAAELGPQRQSEVSAQVAEKDP